MIRLEIELSLPTGEGGVLTAIMRAAQTLDLGDTAVVHRITAEEVAA